MRQRIAIAIAYGDGIGPEIMEASIRTIQESGTALELEMIEIGEEVYMPGNSRASIPVPGNRYGALLMASGIHARARPISGRLPPPRRWCPSSWAASRIGRP